MVNLKSCLEIMNLKREEMSVAFAAVEGIDLDIKQAMAFCQDAVELEISIYVSHGSHWHLYLQPMRQRAPIICVFRVVCTRRRAPGSLSRT